MLVGFSCHHYWKHNDEERNGERDEQDGDDRREDPRENEKQYRSAFGPSLFAVERAAGGRDEMQVVHLFHAEPAEFTGADRATDVIARAIVEFFDRTFT